MQRTFTPGRERTAGVWVWCRQPHPHTSQEPEISDTAAQLRAERQHRVNCPVSMVDRVTLATAIVMAETIATSATHLARLARLLAVPLEAIANSFGVPPDSERPTPGEVAPTTVRRTSVS